MTSSAPGHRLPLAIGRLPSPCPHPNPLPGGEGAKAPRAPTRPPLPLREGQGEREAHRPCPPAVGWTTAQPCPRVAAPFAQERTEERYPTAIPTRSTLFPLSLRERTEVRETHRQCLSVVGWTTAQPCPGAAAPFSQERTEERYPKAIPTRSTLFPPLSPRETRGERNPSAMLFSRRVDNGAALSTRSRPFLPGEDRGEISNGNSLPQHALPPLPRGEGRGEGKPPQRPDSTGVLP